MHLMIFYGSYMRGQPGHVNATGCRFVEAVETAAKYRVFSMGEYPVMIRTTEGGVAVAGELYEVPDEVWTQILATEPPGLCPGRVELADGRIVEGMLPESESVLRQGVDISAYGGWAAYADRSEMKE